MTSSRLLKVFAALALLFAAAAAWLWYTTGDSPNQTLTRLSAATLLAALVTGLVGADTRPRLMLRFLAALFALFALIAFAADLAREPAAGESVGSISLLQHLQTLAPSLAAAMERWISHSFGTAAWSPILTSFLSLPASLTFLGLAIIAGIAGRPRQRVRIFVNDL